jgi:hypothetical protein
VRVKSRAAATARGYTPLAPVLVKSLQSVDALAIIPSGQVGEVAEDFLRF